MEEVSDEDRRIISVFVKILIENGLLSSLVLNISRLDEGRPDDKQGIYNTISLISNLVEIDPSIADLIYKDTKFVQWLLRRMGEKQFDSVRQYASEVLEVLVQTSEKIRNGLSELENIDALLQILAHYIRNDPSEADEVEMVENIFNVLCLLLSNQESKKLFLKSEGFELMLLMIKYLCYIINNRQRKMCRKSAVKVIDHALTGSEDDTSSHHFINLLGLGTLFSLLMQKGGKSYKRKYTSFSQKEEDEHLVSIISSLFKYTTENSLLARLNAKFVESNFEKLDRLVNLFHSYLQKTFKGNLIESINI